MASKSTWTYEQNKIFEDALAIHVDNKDVQSGDRWEKIAKAVGEGKSVEDVRRHYKALEEDIMLIESGAVPLPKYTKLGNKNGGYNKGKSIIIREEERTTSRLTLR
ncbi:hypothetical protein Leryth_005318 [Lithospermum erythrorhizon]|nr:hypothetical protein Leryth_005318 [Lithospermum erythrorhizon]